MKPCQIATRPEDEHLGLRILNLAHDIVAFAILIHAAIGLAALPNAPSPVLGFFIPPTMAFLFLICNTGKFNRTVLAGCRLFLGLIASFVLLAHLPFVLPNLKPQFPGLPPQQDRVVCFYLVAYALFLWVFCPAYVLGISLYRDYNRISPNMAWPILYAGLACWLLTMGFLVIGFVIQFNDFF
jgi:hypothetical protein